MSYETDIMRNLTSALRQADGLKYSIKEFNQNMEIIKNLELELAKANELKEIELGIRSIDNYSFASLGNSKKKII